MSDVDLRSYFPALKRTITLPDGNDYFIRELIDLPIGTFNRFVADEKSFTELQFSERLAIERQHLQTLVVSIVTTRGVAPKSDRTLRLAGEGALDLAAGDVVHVSGGLYFERNTVESISDDKRTATMQAAWRFDASDGARVYRAVRTDAIDSLNFVEFTELMAKIKTLAEASGGEADPQKAASGSTSSTTNSLP